MAPDPTQVPTPKHNTRRAHRTRSVNKAGHHYPTAEQVFKHLEFPDSRRRWTKQHVVGATFIKDKLANCTDPLDIPSFDWKAFYEDKIKDIPAPRIRSKGQKNQTATVKENNKRPQFEGSPPPQKTSSQIVLERPTLPVMPSSESGPSGTSQPIETVAQAAKITSIFASE